MEGCQGFAATWSSGDDVEAAWFPSSDDLVEVGPGCGGEGRCLGGEVGDLGEAGVVVDEGGAAGADLVEEFADAGFCVAGVSAGFDDLEAARAGVVEVSACGVVDELVGVYACEVDVSSVDAVHGVEEVVGGDVGCGDGGEFVEEEVWGESLAGVLLLVVFDELPDGGVAGVCEVVGVDVVEVDEGVAVAAEGDADDGGFGVHGVLGVGGGLLVLRASVGVCCLVSLR